MKPDIEFQHIGLVLDACCAINLCVSGQIEAILKAIPVQVAISEFVAEQEVQRFDLHSLTEAGLLSGQAVENEEEAVNVLTFVATLGGDGEAYTGATALRLGWAIVSDEKRVLNYYRRQAPQLQCLTTPELVKYWADHAHPPTAIVRQTLQAIEEEGNYTISPRHECYRWWRSYLGTGDSADNT